MPRQSPVVLRLDAISGAVIRCDHYHPMSYRKSPCPHCQGHVEYPASGSGEAISFPHCAEAFVLPRSAVRSWRPLYITGGILAVMVLVSVLANAFWPAELPSVGTEYIWMLLMVGVYFLPSFVAAGNKHRQSTAIFLLNLLLGWTVLGWIAALIWSAYREKEK